MYCTEEKCLKILPSCVQIFSVSAEVGCPFSSMHSFSSASFFAFGVIIGVTQFTSWNVSKDATWPNKLHNIVSMSDNNHFSHLNYFILSLPMHRDMSQYCLGHSIVVILLFLPSPMTYFMGEICWMAFLKWIETLFWIGYQRYVSIMLMASSRYAFYFFNS